MRQNGEVVRGVKTEIVTIKGVKERGCFHCDAPIRNEHGACDICPQDKPPVEAFFIKKTIVCGGGGTTCLV